LKIIWPLFENGLGLPPFQNRRSTVFLKWIAWSAFENDSLKCRPPFINYIVAFLKIDRPPFQNGPLTMDKPPFQNVLAIF